MRPGRTVLASLILLLAASTTFADFEFFDFTSVDGINLVQDATQFGNVLRLTPAAGAQRGAAWFAEPQMIANGFETTFEFRIEPSGAGADGMAFLIQDDEAFAIAGGGGSLGYGDDPSPGTGMPRSVAIELDTWNNSNYSDPDANHISVHSQGTLANTANESASLGITSTIPILGDSQIHVCHIEYMTGELSIYLDDLDVPVLVVVMDLPGLIGSEEAWVGFTGATGGVSETHDVLSWSFGGTGPGFGRGDADGDGHFNGLADALFVLNSQFIPGAPEPGCLDAADADDDGNFNALMDGLFILEYQLIPGSPPPPPPGPFSCGLDGTDDSLDCAQLSCP